MKMNMKASDGITHSHGDFSKCLTSSMSELMRSRRCFSTVLWLTAARSDPASGEIYLKELLAD
jgi:hypothetical protein